jgi:broad specificity phosphatase PhoE
VLPRAIETATVLTPVLRRDLETNCNLCEVHVGVADGMTYEDAGRLFGWPGPWEHPPEGGETVEGFGERVTRTIEALGTESSGTTTVIVTHSGFITAACYWLLRRARKQDEAIGQRRLLLEPSYTSITEWSRGATNRGS